MVYEMKFILIAIAVLVIIYDFVCFINYGIDFTLHRAVLSLGQYHPIIYLIFGVMGCLFLLPQKDK